MGDSLGDRMKGYEKAFRTSLPRRMPVIIRVDGRAFHTYTRANHFGKTLDRPFDQRLGNLMASTALHLCKQVQGAQLAYLQSDEISVLVHGYKTFDTQSWFDNQVQKMVAVAAAETSAHFTAHSWTVWSTTVNGELVNTTDAIRPASFDARVFVLPEAEVCNYFLWRQQDASRNSVQMLARSLYSHKECDGKNGGELQEMCWQKGKNWNDLPTQWRRGSCIRRLPGDGWMHDTEIPLFNQDRDYIDRLLELEEG